MDWSITANSLIISMALAGQIFAQTPQPMQPALQTLLTAGPLQCELHLTIISAVAGTSVKIPFGHAVTHAPQPTHLLTSTFGSPSLPIDNAPNWQTLTHVPRPMQPKGHEFGEPPGIVAAEAQSFIPS